MEYNHQELALKRRKLALEYKENMKRLGEIKQEKAVKLIEIMGREDTKSQKHAELIFSTTEEGQEELKITFYCKGLIELMRALKTEIDIKINESFGNF